MKQGPVFGMACFTGTTCVIENIAMSGLDFIYLDLAIRSADYFDGAAEVTYSRNLNLSSNSTFFVRLNGRYWKANLAESYKTYDSRYMVHLTAGLNF